MAQDPFKVDQIQIEPAATGTRKIRKNADGSLEFVDPTYPSGVKLSTLATAGTAALTAAIKTGTASLVAEATKAVVFDAVYADAIYSIMVEFDDDPVGPWWVTAKTAAGFTVNLAAPVTLGIRWTTIRLS
jgi:hypothetical protein